MAQGVRRKEGRKTKSGTSLDVFINCPFDPEFKSIFNAIVFTVVRSGYRARCAMETDDAAENRLGKIIKIISECRFGIHDISRTEVGGEPPVPRFNMPLELGLWLGAHHLGREDQAGKKCIVFDRERYRYARFISDISGQDIHSHDASDEVLISELSGWLRHLPGGLHAGGGRAILKEYRIFEEILPKLCDGKGMTPEELSFGDFNLMVTEYVASLIEAPLAGADVNAPIAAQEVPPEGRMEGAAPEVRAGRA